MEIKVFELESYVDRKTKNITRRFIDRDAYLINKPFFEYNNPQIGASHIYKDGKWYVWVDNRYVESDDTFIFVKQLDRL